jgi:hypothetical protein
MGDEAIAKSVNRNIEIEERLWWIPVIGGY